jgi:hypothetical protein
MLKLNLSGSLGRYGYSNLPDDIKNDLIQLALDQAYSTAYQKAPILPGHPIHIREDIKKEYTKGDPVAYLVVRSPYAFPAEFGSKHRLAHPFMVPAARAAKNKIRALLRKSAKEAAEREKLKSGS